MILIASVFLVCCIAYAICDSDSSDAADPVTFSDGGLSYEVTSKDKVKVTGFSGETISNLTIPETVTYNEVTYDVTEIGSEAFAAHMIQTVNLGKVKSIDTGAFLGCVALTTVAGTELSSIGSATFSGCVLLNSVPFSKVLTIGSAAFAGCLALKLVDLSRTVTIGSDAFFESGLTAVHISAITLNIGGGAFNKCHDLTLISCSGLRYGVVNQALYDRLTGTLVCVPEHCLTFGSYTIPDEISKIGSRAFDGCDDLQTINVPAGVTEIESNAFVNCPNLRAVNVDPENSSYRSTNGIVYSSDMTTIVFVPETFSGNDGVFVIPESVTTVADYAFSDCINLTDIDASKVTSVGMYAFSDCYSVEKIHLNADASFGVMSMDLGSLTGSVTADVYAQRADFLSVIELNLFTTVNYYLPVEFTMINKPSEVILPETTYVEKGTVINMSDYIPAKYRGHVDISVNETPIGPEDSWTVTDVAAEVNVVFSEIETYSVTIISSDKRIGSINGMDEITERFEYGTRISMYSNEVTVGDTTYTAESKVSKDGSVVNRLRGFTGLKSMVDGDTVITADFESDVGTVTPDASGSATITTMTGTTVFGDAAIASIKSDVKTLIVVTDTAVLTFDSGAISKLSAGKLSLWTYSEIPDIVKGAYRVIEIDFGSNHDFSGGNITVDIPISITSGNGVAIGYVHDGKVDRIDATYDSEKNIVSYKVDHLSTFAVLDESFFHNDKGDGNAMIYIAIAVVAIAAVGIIGFLFVTGRISFSKKE